MNHTVASPHTENAWVGWCCDRCYRQHKGLVAQLVREIEGWRQSRDKTPEDARQEIAALSAACDDLHYRLAQCIGERVYGQKSEQLALDTSKGGSSGI